MADLTITATSVVPGGSAKTVEGTAGAAITAGQVVYKEASSGTLKLADCDSATAEVRSPLGIALNGAAIGQPVEVLKEGNIVIGGTVAASTPYFLSPTAGGICPLADVLTGDYGVFLGWGISTTQIAVKIVECGVVKA